MYPVGSRVASIILAESQQSRPGIERPGCLPRPGAFVYARGMRGTADGSFSADVKAAVTLRARSGCERCGRWCGEGAWAEHHHRSPRGMGGASAERAAVISSPANCLLLCARCHRWVERHRSDAYVAGWLVSWSDDPSSVPVEVYERGPVLLDASGGYARVGGDRLVAVSRPGLVRTRW